MKEDHLLLFSKYKSEYSNQLSKILLTEEDDLFFLDKKVDIELYKRFIKKSTTSGSLSFKIEKNNYKIKLMSIFGIPYLLDENNGCNHIVIKKFDLSRVPNNL